MSTAPDPAFELARQVARWCTAHVDAAALEAGGEIPGRLLDGLAALGLFAMTLPAKHDGAELGLASACHVVEELARHDRSVATTVGLHAGLGTQAVVRGARPELGAAWLPRLASGAAIGAFAATEAGAGSDLMSIRTALIDDGNELYLDGEKSYVTNARYAGCFTVLARRGPRGHSLVLVPRSAAGITIGPEESKLGLRASSTATVRFDAVRLPRHHVLGADGRGLELAYQVLGWGRTMMAAGCTGTARAALAATLDHVDHRRQFRRSLLSFPAVQLQVAEMAALTEASRAFVRRVATTLDRGTDAEMLSMALKVFASEQAFRACDTAIQLHGALGVIEPVGVARLLRDCRVTRIFEGANDVLLVRLATARLATAAPLERANASVGRDEAAHLHRMADAIDAATADVRRRMGFAAVTRQATLVGLARAELAYQAALALALDPPRDEDLAAVGIAALERDAHVALESLDAAEATAVRADRICNRLRSAPAGGTAAAPLTERTA